MTNPNVMDKPEDRVSQCAIELKWHGFTLSFPERTGRPKALRVSVEPTNKLTKEERTQMVGEVASEYGLECESQNEYVKVVPDDDWERD